MLISLLLLRVAQNVALYKSKQYFNSLLNASSVARNSPYTKDRDSMATPLQTQS